MHVLKINSGVIIPDPPSYAPASTVLADQDGK